MDRVTHSRKSPRRRLLVLLGVLATSLGAISLLAGPAGADPSQPGSSPSNPITQVGPPAAMSVLVDIRWPEGAQEAVPMGTLPTTATQAQVASLRAQAVAAREAAEGRSPSTGKLLNPTPRALSTHRRRGDSADGGIYTCGVAMILPYKSSSSTVSTSATTTCSDNVESVEGTIYLYRSSSYILIGANYYVGGYAYTAFFTTGSCAHSTWQYNSELDYIMHTPSGDFDFGHTWGPSWITC